MLERAGHPIPESTLKTWRDRHSDRFQRIVAEVTPRIDAELQSEFVALIRKNNEAEDAALDRFKDLVGELPARDLSTAVRNFAVSSGVHADKLPRFRLEQDVPTDRTPEDVLRRLAQLGAFVDGTATERPSDRARPPAKTPRRTGSR